MRVGEPSSPKASDLMNLVPRSFDPDDPPPLKEQAKASTVRVASTVLLCVVFIVMVFRAWFAGGVHTLHAGIRPFSDLPPAAREPLDLPKDAGPILVTGGEC